MTDLPPPILDQKALVGVIQTSSERDHNSDAGRETFREGLLPWVEFDFYDEYSVDTFVRRIKEHRFTAVCFASNALFNPVIYDACRAQACDIIEASKNGMGIVLLQQFLPDEVTRKCDFLPDSHRLIYSGIGHQPITKFQFADDVKKYCDESIAGQLQSRTSVLWSTVTPRVEGAWCPLVKATAGGTHQPVVLRTRLAQGRVVASALPLDWLADDRLLAYAIRLAVRSLGTLYIHPEDERATGSIALELLLGRARARGGHVTAMALENPSNLRSQGDPLRTSAISSSRSAGCGRR